MVINPYLQIVLASLIWGSAGVFIKLLGFPPTTFGFFRCFIPLLFIVPWFYYKKIKFKQSKNMWYASLFSAIRLPLFFYAVITIPMSIAITVFYIWPVFAMIFAKIFLKEKIHKRNIALLIVSFIGIYFIYRNATISITDNFFLGITAAILSALCYSSTVILFKKENSKFSRVQTLLFQNLVGAIMFIPFIFINRPIPTITETVWGTIYGFAIGIVGFGLFFSALKKIKASIASTMSYLEVISAIIYGIIIFKEALTPSTVIGMVLILISTIFLKRK